MSSLFWYYLPYPQESDLAAGDDETVSDKAGRAKLIMLKKKLEEKDRIIAEKEEELAAKETLIEAKVKVISEQEAAVKTLSSQLEGNANLIAQLQSEQTTDSPAPEVCLM